jgi:sugar phosphate isomerase/epimerase
MQRRRFLGAAGALAAAAIVPNEAHSDETKQEPKARKFKLGTVTYNIAKDWDVATMLKVCRDTGLAAVEARTTHKHGIEPGLNPDQRKEVKQRFADSGVVFWGCGSVCEFHSPDATEVQKHVEICKRFIQLTADLGGKGVKVRPNGLPKNVSVEKTLEQIGKALVECGKAAADAGVEIWVEVHGGGTSLPANMKSIMEHCGHPAVGVTWNSNQTDLVNKSVAQSFALLRPWIRSCHINDLYNDEKGVYPYRELFALLRSIDYDRYTLIEVGKTMPTMESSLEYLKCYRALWHELSKG